MIFTNELEFSPFSQKGINAVEFVLSQLKNNIPIEQLEAIKEELLNEDFFFEKFYVQPFTRFCIKEVDVKDDERINYSAIHSALLEKNSQFLNALRSNILNVFWLYGNAGCGKTTYLHKLKKDYNNVQMDIYDFENIKRRVSLIFGDKRFRVGDDDIWENHHCYKFCLLLTDIIFEKLKLQEYLNNKNNKFLKNIIQAYKELELKIQTSDVVDNFFDIINGIANDCSLATVQGMVNFISNIIDDDTLYRDENNCTSINKLIQILSHLMLCIGTINQKRVMVAFDNIEYYIKIQYDNEGNRIADKTVEIILRSITSALDEQATILSRNHINNVPCFLVSTRPATVTFNHNGQSANHYEVDLTKWFWAKEIYENKVTYLLQYMKDSTRKIYKIFTLILDDCTESSWSLGILLPRLFNYDYRRLCRVTLLALKLGFCYNNEKSFLLKSKRFLNIWENAKVTKNGSSNTRHLCRLYILRIILNIFNSKVTNTGDDSKECSFFNYLMFENSFHTSNKIDSDWIVDSINNCKIYNIENKFSSYARKILTILHRVEIDNLYNANIGEQQLIRYFDFEELLKELFLRGNHAQPSDISDELINVISKILYIMNKYSNEADWVPLTTIKWNCDAQNYSEDKLREVLIAARNNIEKNAGNDSKYGIRINPAGQVLLKVLPEFEFFGLRFCSDLPLLFENEAMQKKDGVWVAESIINIVLRNVINCVNKVIKRDKEYFSAYGERETNFRALFLNTKWIYLEQRTSRNADSHPVRIFNQQINFLIAYRNYVDGLSLEDLDFVNEEHKEDFLKMVNKKIELYKLSEALYRKKYANYFTKY